MDVMICRWVSRNDDFIAWVRADASNNKPHHILERYLLYGETMEILETFAFTLPDRKPGYKADRCEYWRKELGINVVYRGEQLIHGAVKHV